VNLTFLNLYRDGESYTESQYRGWMKVAGLRIPTHRGHLLRFDRGQATDLMAATIPI